MTPSQPGAVARMSTNPLFPVIHSLFSVDRLEREIFSDRICAISIYTLLGSVPQEIIDSIMFISGPLPFSHIRTLHPPEERSEWNKALLLLKQLGILQGRGQDLWINAVYQRSLLSGIAYNARPASSVSVSLDHDTSLTDYESLLYNLTSSPKKVDKELLALFHASGLLRSNEVTQSGFQFLVHPINVQLWTVLAEWLQHTKGTANLALLLHLARMQPGHKYDVAVGVFQKLGLFTSHHLATALVLSLVHPTAPNAELRILVETNYHLYAYSPTPLSLAVLSLFTAPKDRLPNLLRARMTHDSVRAAYKRGITAAQLILYLSTHSDLPLPPALTDQLRLWEADMQRVRSVDGYMYSQFLQQADFEAAKLAVGPNNVLYSNAATRVLIVNETGHAALR